MQYLNSKVKPPIVVQGNIIAEARFEVNNQIWGLPNT